MSSHETRTINLLKGYPNPSLLPAQAISDAAKTVLADEAISTPGLLYGADEGYLPFRYAIAQWNTSFYGRQVTKDNIIISGGASQNLACVLQVFTDPLFTQNVWIVSPAYMLVFRIFEDHGFAGKMRAVPEIKDGLDVEWLGSELDKCAELIRREPARSNKLKPDRPFSKHYRHVLYCVPSFSNPSSGIMSLERRRALVRLARKHDMLVITDDVYDHLQWKSGPVEDFQPLQKALSPRLVDIDAELDGGFLRDGADGFGNTLSNGSFSKIVAPGARCGWTDAAPKLAYGVSQSGSSTSGGAPSQLTSTYIMHLLTSGWLPNHIFHTLQPAYSKRYHTLRTALEKHVIPLGCSITRPAEYTGGFFIWIRLPPGTRADELARNCLSEHNLMIMSGDRFEVPASDRICHNDHIRLCFAYEDVSLLEEGAVRLGRALESYAS